MKRSELVAVLALFLAAASFAYTVFATRSARITAAKPVLIFEYSGSEGWMLRNVGNGPALDVVVAIRGESGDWSVPVRVPPIARESAISLEYLSPTNSQQLGASYSDTEGLIYSSHCAKDLTRVFEGSEFPEWPEAEITALWAAKPIGLAP